MDRRALRDDQTASGWASVTAVLRDRTGMIQPVTLTIEKAAKPQIAISLGDVDTVLNGNARARIRESGK